MRAAEEVDGTHRTIGAILFDTKYYTAQLNWGQQKVIDTFFDNLEWDEVNSNPTADILNFGVLMDIVDWNNRWTYKGSMTTPPCEEFVHWNVLRQIYPISEKHLKLFHGQLDKRSDQTVYDGKSLSEFGNYREIQRTNKHGLMYVKEDDKLAK